MEVPPLATRPRPSFGWPVVWSLGSSRKAAVEEPISTGSKSVRLPKSVSSPLGSVGRSGVPSGSVGFFTMVPLASALPWKRYLSSSVFSHR